MLKYCLKGVNLAANIRIRVSKGWEFEGLEWAYFGFYVNITEKLIYLVKIINYGTKNSKGKPSIR